MDKSFLGAFICVFYVYCFDESYLRCFYLCFECLEFLHKKIKTVLITSITILLLLSLYLKLFSCLNQRQLVCNFFQNKQNRTNNQSCNDYIVLPIFF